MAEEVKQQREVQGRSWCWQERAEGTLWAPGCGRAGAEQNSLSKFFFHPSDSLTPTHKPRDEH